MVDLKLHYSQKKNVLINFLEKSIHYEFGSTHADFEFKNGTVIIFIQLRFLLASTDYLDSRLSYFKDQARDQTRVCLCYHDINDTSENLLLKVNKLCLLYDFSLLCAYSMQDAARYVSYLGQTDVSELNRVLRNAEKHNLPLPKIKGSLSEGDIKRLIKAKGTIANIFTSSAHDLSLIPGFKSAKCKFLWQLFNSPLIHHTNRSEEVEKGSHPMPSREEGFLRTFSTQFRGDVHRD